MKRFSEIIKTISVLLGSVIGAGFLSGAELTVFFGTEDFVPFLFVSGISFFVGFSLFFICQKQELRFDSSEERFFNITFFISCAIFSSAMLAGINDLFRGFGIKYLYFLPSLFVLVITYFLSGKGGMAAEKVNSIIMPATLLAAIIFMFTTKGTAGAEDLPVKNKKFLVPVLFAFMNVFITVPAASETLANKSEKTLIVSSALFSVIMSVLSFLILSVVKKAGTACKSLPLLYAFGKNGFMFCAFAICIFLCSFTSFYVCYFPLAEKLKKKRGKKSKIVFSLVVYLLSLTGLGNIVKYVYPLVGAAGTVYIAKIAFYLVRKKVGIKANKKADNTIKDINGGTSMSKKKKNKVKKLTDEEYGNYIMSLKDEKPPLLVRKTQTKS